MSRGAAIESRRGELRFFEFGGKVVDLPFIDPALNGPFVVFLCSDEADWITGQIFGTGADRVIVVEQPRYGAGMFKPGGWRWKTFNSSSRRPSETASSPSA